MDNPNLNMDVAAITSQYLAPLRLPELSKRRYREEGSRAREEGELQRDYARIMYSSSFRRLQGKMQLLGIKNDRFFRNRLTHSLEVAQIARSIAYKLRYSQEESYVVEACALAHDMGNPPFGHAGESCLQEIFAGVGGFEGNAQTLRILTTAETKKPDFKGLNLTYRTLLGVVKYFRTFDKEKYERDHKTQKFIYKEDYDLLKTFIERYQVKLRTMDVQIIDLADEIAYAAHDLEDGLRAGLFTVEDLLHDYLSQYGDCGSYQKLNEIVGNARVSVGFGRVNLDSSAYSKMLYQEISSAVIFTLINDIALVAVPEEKAEKTRTSQGMELGFSQYGDLASGLKDIVFRCINHNDDVYAYEQEGNRALRWLCNFYRENSRYLPPEYRAKEAMKSMEAKTDEKLLQERLICDYIAGMMDSFAIATYEKYSGKRFLGDRS